MRADPARPRVFPLQSRDQPAQVPSKAPTKANDAPWRNLDLAESRSRIRQSIGRTRNRRGPLFFRMTRVPRPTYRRVRGPFSRQLSLAELSLAEKPHQKLTELHTNPLGQHRGGHSLDPFG